MDVLAACTSLYIVLLVCVYRLTEHWYCYITAVCLMRLCSFYSLWLNRLLQNTFGTLDIFIQKLFKMCDETVAKSRLLSQYGFRLHTDCCLSLWENQKSWWTCCTHMFSLLWDKRHRLSDQLAYSILSKSYGGYDFFPFILSGLADYYKINLTLGKILLSLPPSLRLLEIFLKSRRNSSS